MSLKAHQEMAASPTEDNYKRALGPKNEWNFKIRTGMV